MLYTTSVMADHLESELNVNSLKEECQDGVLTDDKIHISETAIVIGNAELQNHLIRDETKAYDISNTVDNIKTELSSLKVQYDIVHGTLKKEGELSADAIKSEFNDGQLCNAELQDHLIHDEMKVYDMSNTVDNIKTELSPPKVQYDIVRGTLKKEGELSTDEIKVNLNDGLLYLMQCPSCKIHLDQKEYFMHHMACCERNDKNWILSTSGNRTTQVNGRKMRPHQKYICQQCRYRTKYKGDLKNHTNQHYEVKMFKCEICYRRFKTKTLLRRHTKNAVNCADEQGDLEHSTGVDMMVRVKAEHLCSQNEIEQLKCSMCEFRTRYKRSLKRHMAVKHWKKRNYKCDICDYEASLKSYLKEHIKVRHLKEFKYKCDRCDYKANRKPYLNEHVEVRHLKEFKHKCGTCDYKTNRKSDLKKHTETRHLKEFKYKCDRCDYKANRKFNLQTHIEARHLKEFKHKCDTCDYKTHWKSNLKLHVETKHLKFKHECDACGYKANRKSILKEHTDTKHLKEFKYKCNICDYKANWKSNLKVHIEAKHLAEFKYKCDACDYKTNNKSHLKSHVESKHTKELAYKCDTCDFKTNWKSNLKQHIETKHLKEFKYKCDTCDYKTNRKSHLKVHLQTRHL